MDDQEDALLTTIVSEADVVDRESKQSERRPCATL